MLFAWPGSTVRPRPQDSCSEKNRMKNTFKLVFSAQNSQKRFIGLCVFLSACFVFFLGLLGFELETPTANTRSTLPGPSSH